MCKFFSFVTKGNKRYYLNWETRQQFLEKNPYGIGSDSHSSICEFHKLNDDKVNKYEYNFLLKTFTVDQINIKDDRALAEKWVRNLDSKLVIEPLIVKPIIHPLKIACPEITDKHIELLKQWDSVRVSVWDSVWDSVRYSVRDSVRDSVGDSVGDSVRDSVRDSVWDSVRDSVRYSVRYSVRDSVRDSVWVYISSFFNIEKWKYIDHEPFINPFQCCVDLWEQGLVPSFDGKTWRLRGGGDAKVLYEITAERLNK